MGTNLFIELLSGAVAGFAVEAILYPLDTAKTRLQSKVGFWKSGGYSNLYKGISACLSGSVPSSALFFAFYSFSKNFLSNIQEGRNKATGETPPQVHMIASMIGEVAACLTRTPAEVIKQRLQAKVHTSGTAALREILSTEGVTGFYKAYPIMIAREIPFSLIQFPLYEHLKLVANNYYSGADKEVPIWILSLCGMLAGGISAALTTPLDVLKTRTIIESRIRNKKEIGRKVKIFTSIKSIYFENHKNLLGTTKTLFSGVVPRVIWISLGGMIFFGFYERTNSFLSEHLEKHF